MTPRTIVAFPDHITTVVDLPTLRTLSTSLFGLGLGPGWPLAEQPGFATAGFRLGNINLEICAVDRKENPLDDWLTFEPVDLDSLAESLATQGLSYDPFDAMIAGGHPIYTRVDLPALATNQTALQLCHTFYPTRTTGPEAPTNSAGIVRTRSVNIAIDPSHQTAFNLFMQSTTTQDNYTFTDGPELVVSSSDTLRVDGLTVECVDPNRAAKALIDAGLQRVSDTEVSIGSLTLQLTTSH